MHMVYSPVASIIIPAYNEQATIGNVLGRTFSTMEKLGLPYEIIVVDDGSTDNTRLSASSHKIRLVSYNDNRGKGHAVRVGLCNAKGQIIVTLDADGSHNPEEIPALVEPLFNGIDVVIGSRFLGDKAETVTSRLHVLGNQLFNLLIMILTRKKITDSQTGFRAYKKRVLSKIGIFSEGYEIETELTIRTLNNGFTVQETAISCEKRKHGCSQLNAFADGLKILKTILKASIL